jgi:hypothetical protein
VKEEVQQYNSGFVLLGLSPELVIPGFFIVGVISQVISERKPE